MWMHNSDVGKKHIHSHIDILPHTWAYDISVKKKQRWTCYTFESELVLWCSLGNLRLFAKIMDEECCVREKRDACDGPFFVTLREGGFMFLDAEDDALKAFSWTLSLNATRASDGEQNFHSRLNKEKQRRTWKKTKLFRYANTWRGSSFIFGKIALFVREE